jgi:hypothetical protein
MAKKESNLFMGPHPGEDVQVITINNIKIGGVVVGTWDDAINILDTNGDNQIVSRAAITAMLIKAIKPEEIKEEGVPE